MRFVTFDCRGRPRPGVRVGDRVHDISWLAPTMEEVVARLADDPGALAGADRAPSLAAADTPLLAPLTRPGKIVCVGLNYREHAAETGRAELPDYPTLFARWPTTLVGPGAALQVPAVSEQLDYEGELAVVIGRGGRHIPVATALDHVFAYSVFDDASVRDLQRRTSQFTPGKNADATGGFGPELVTADELPPGASGLRLVTRVNGAVRQDATTDQMIFDVATLVATVSSFATLAPADVIVTGTPAGVGAAHRPPRWLRAGDVVEVSIEGIGTLVNPVAHEV